MLDDAAEFFFFLPPYQNFGDAVDALGRDEVLGIALLENPAGIHEEDFALPCFWLGLVEEQHDAWSGGVVEEVFGQVEDALDKVGEAVVVEFALAVGGSVEVDAINDALQGLVFTSNGPHVGGYAFADLVRELANDRPDRLFGIVRHEGKIEADELVVSLDELEGLLPRADLCGNAVHFVIEDVAEALGEDERENIVLVFRRVFSPADGTGGIPYPGFERFVFGNKFSHAGIFQSNWNLSAPIGSGTFPGLSGIKVRWRRYG